jgi:hypothetical protein
VPISTSAGDTVMSCEKATTVSPKTSTTEKSAGKKVPPFLLAPLFLDLFMIARPPFEYICHLKLSWDR